MKITGATTDEQLTAPVQAARARLAKVAATEVGYEELVKMAHDVAEEDGRLLVRWTLRNAMAHGATQGEAEATLTQLLLRSPGDTWSGRTNDARRCYMDGVRDEVKSLIEFGAMRRLFAGQEV